MSESHPKYQCLSCGKYFLEESKAKHHKDCTKNVSSITSAAEGFQRCCDSYYECQFPQCNFSHPVLDKALQHWSQSHKFYQCILCGQIFNEKQLMDVHSCTLKEKQLKLQRPENINATATIKDADGVFYQFCNEAIEYQCNICQKDTSKTFKTPRFSPAQKHLESHIYECYQCNQSFTNEKQFKIHFRQHIIDRKFTLRTGQDVDPNPIECKYCPLSFKTEEEKRAHKQMKHPDMELSCHICFNQERFHTKFELQAHVDKKHPRHTCLFKINEETTCNHSFRHKIDHDKHQLWHEKVPLRTKLEEIRYEEYMEIVEKINLADLKLMQELSDEKNKEL